MTISPSMIRLMTWLTLFGWLISLPLYPPAANAQQRSAAFRSSRCMFTLPNGAIEGRDVECGYLTVPERHSQPEGPTIELAVAILKSHSAHPASDPLVMLQGGPGGSTIDTYASTLLSQQSLPINRDIVLFDQRGTLYAHPNLRCPETFDLLLRTIGKRQSDEEQDQQSLAAINACHTRLTASGANLANYDTIENAADVEALRVALGYNTINLYGVSYGTLLALQVMRDYGANLRSVILDAVVPPQINFVEQVPRTQQRAFNEFFGACAADVHCNAAYPHLEQVFWRLVDALNQKPAQVSLADPDSGLTYQAFFDGDMLVDALFQMLYITSIIPALPKMISDVQAGNYAFLSRVYAILLFDRTFSEGMYYSTVCAEDANFQLQDLPLDGVRPELAQDAQRSTRLLLAICQRWNVPPLEPIVHAPVQSAVPTLVLNGRFDPITPPTFGQTAAQTLSHSYNVIFPNTGHGALLENACATSIARSFIANPQQAPPVDCVAQQTAPQFLTPDNVLMSPSVTRMLAALTGNNPYQLLALLVMALSLLVMLSTVVLWPLSFVIRLAQHRPTERRGTALLARGVALLVAVCGTLFVAGTGYALFATDAANSTVLAFGLPRSYAPLFVLPLLLVVCAAAMLVLTVVAWRQRFWTIWQRLYYTLLTCGALGIAGTLLWWGVPGALFGI